MKTSRKSGFTLVELLVVIGIIAVLVSILLPSLSKARLSAQKVQCMSNVRQLTLAIQNYAAANKGGLPRYRASNAGYGGRVADGAQMCPGSVAGGPTKWPVDWTYLILKYTGATPRTELFQCPARVWRTNRTQTFVYEDGKTYKSPLISYRVNGTAVGDADTEFTAAYSIVGIPTSSNNFAKPIDRPFGPVFRRVNDTGTTYDLVDYEETLKISRVASDTIMMAECVRRIAGAAGNNSNGEASATYFSYGPSTALTSFSTSSHKDKSCSVAFFDGSVKTITAAELAKVPRNKNDMNNPQYSLWTAEGNNQANPGDMYINGWNSKTNPARGWFSGTRDD